MRIETRAILFCVLVIGLLLVLLALNPGTPDYNPRKDNKNDDERHDVNLNREIVADVPAEREVEVEQPKPQPKAPPRAQVSTRGGVRTDQNNRPIGPYTPSTFSPDVRFVTGEWTDELLRRQFSLLKKLQTPQSDIERPDAPAESPNDDAIIQQLLNREKCDKFQRNVPWSREDLVRELEYFVKNVYPNRPIKFNTFGMRISHTFGCWFITRWLQPEIIIENGVHLGQSTWLLRQAAPNAKIYSHDPRSDMQHWDKDAIYHVGPTGDRKPPPGINVQPFIDFTDMDWSFIKNKSSVLVLFDDHQSSWKRIQLSQKLGFKHLFIDDNWSPLQGDNYSGKQICDESGGNAYRRPNFPSSLVLLCDNFHMADKFITLDEHKANREQFLSMMKTYYESPPVLFVPALMEFTKFGHTPSKDKDKGVRYELPRPSNKLIRAFMETTISPPLVQTQEEFDRVGLQIFPHREFLNYANFGYLELL